MEKIESLVNVLGKFGDQLGTLKDVISEVHAGVSKHTLELKSELASFKQKSRSAYFLEAEKEIKERIVKLKVEIGKLEMLKRKKEESVDMKSSINNVSRASSTTNLPRATSIESVNAGSERKPTWREISNRDFDYQSSRTSPASTRSVVVPSYQIKREQSNHNNSSSALQPDAQPLDSEWWKEDNEALKSNSTDEAIDWKKEYAEREECKYNLMIQEGWKKMNATSEELETILSTWTGKLIKWTVVKKGKAKGGKTLFSIKFDDLEDRAKVYGMRKQIAEEGYLFVGEALSYVEKKERWVMLMMSERLKREGKQVEFENRKICVDNEWWKYDFVDGWKRL